ncbi:MAG: serine/threonine protein kinase, partial [Gemmatimonadota bacterium]|nr:serine/threonine protein kinase [Gemmatimonadota bacterium]
EARDRSRGDHVAVKVLRPEFAVTVLNDRFHREIQILSQLDHPNILPLIESSESGNFLYFVMPLAHGGSLRDRLNDEKRLDVQQALSITRDVAAALDYAHEHNVVHRDIKPENVMFDADHAMICDFGVARAIVQAGGEHLSSSGLIVGTPTYMSPEQASAESEIDHRSDVYSLGCVVYEMLAGEPPFSGRTAQAVLARHIGERPPSLRVVRPDISEHIEIAIRRALAKKAEERWGSGGALVAALT